MKQYMITMPQRLADRLELYNTLKEAGGNVIWTGPDSDYCKVKCEPAFATFASLKYGCRVEEAKG